MHLEEGDSNRNNEHRLTKCSLNLVCIFFAPFIMSLTKAWHRLDHLQLSIQTRGKGKVQVCDILYL